MRLSDTNLEKLRTRPSQTALDLFVFKPRTVLACQVNNPSIAKGARTIAFDSVSNGSHTSVEAGMTLLVGSAPGLSDVGRIRIKSATNASIEVAENSNIKWQDDLHLTVIRYWDLWTVFPRIISDPNNSENVIFYKDYDIPYVNQNFYMGTFINAGSHRPVLIESSTGTAYYSATGTYNMLGNSLSYNWAFEGGTPTGSTSAVPGNVYYTTPGDYVTRLIVTDLANGNTDTTYRYVSVRNKIGEGSNTPIVKWEMSGLSGSRDEGGYTANFKIFSPEIDIDENCLVMLHARDWYGSERISLGGNYPNNGQTFFVGYVEKGSIHYNAFHSYVSFTALSVTGMMKKLTGFSVSVESKSNPSTWFELNDMDCRRAIYHYLKWHSTVLSVTDFSFIGTDRKIQFYDVDRTSVFDAVDNLMKSALVGRVSSDRQGRLWADIDPKAYDNPTGTFVPVMEITNRDWKNEPNIEENIYDTSSYIEAGGIAYSGAITGTFSALLSGAPGLAPSNHGSVEKISGLALGSQEQLNQLSGNLWADRNQPYPSVGMEMATPPRNLDIAPQEVVSIKVQRADTVRDAQIEGIYIPDGFTWSYSPKNQILTARVDYKGVVSGNPGDTIIIPAAVEDGDYNFEFPQLSFPSFPPVYFPNLPIVEPVNTNYVIVHIADRGVFYTNDFTSDYPSWQSANSNLSGDVANLRLLENDASGRIYIQNSGLSVWSAPSPGSAWTKFFDFSILNSLIVPPPILGVSPFVNYYGVDRDSGKVLVIGQQRTSVFAFLGDSSGVQVTTGVNAFLFDASTVNRFGKATYDGENWLITYGFLTGVSQGTTARLLNSSANTTLAGGTAQLLGVSTNESLIHMRPRYAPNIVIAKVMNSAQKSLISYDYGVSYVPITGTAFPYAESVSNPGTTTTADRGESVITNADGSHILIATDNHPTSFAQGIHRSLDGGATWSTGTFQSSGTTSIWHIGNNSYVYAGNNSIYLIEDAVLSTGSVNKTGNLRNLVTGSFEVLAIRHY